MKQLKFAADLVPLVLSGDKTSTWRLFDDKDLTVGDKLSLCDQAGREFATAVISKIQEKALGEISDADSAGHERYHSLEELLATYRQYYGDAVSLQTPAKMIDFILL